MAVIESPGMPNPSAGIQAPARAELLAAPPSTMPSGRPVPNCPGSLDIFLLIADDTQAAMSAPAPGKAPTRVPRTLPRRIDFGYFSARFHIPLNTLPTGRPSMGIGSSLETA